jgi:hypothetical protein
MAIRYEAYCLRYCGGGKYLLVGGKRAAERTATGHANAHRCDITILVRGTLVDGRVV